MFTFPKNFLWGAATSAHQVEGNNKNCDWWEWEKKAGRIRSGSACRHYKFYKQDFDLAKGLHHNAHRLSIEWSRIEPEKGRFSDKALRHYIDVILALRSRDIEPVITLHHFTNPLWLSKRGGWLKRESVGYFLRYCDFVVSALAKHARYWITINEPTIYISHAYIIGAWPPQAKSYPEAAAVEENLFLAHIKAYRRIHEIYKGQGLYRPCVSIAQNIMAFVPCGKDLKNRFAAYLRDKVYNLWFIERAVGHKAMDFIGVNYYSRQLVGLKKLGISNLAMDVAGGNHHRIDRNSLGWDIYPEGLYKLLLELKKYNLPVMITENGICTDNDSLRWRYIRSHLENVHRAIRKGVNVAGYLYWSLMDNFEWDKGFSPRFGLIGINYKTYKRTVRESARRFARVCETGVLK